MEGNAAGVSVHICEMVLKKARWGNNNVNPNRLRLEMEADLCSSRNKKALDVPGGSPSSIRGT